uniref:Uncharacterized protein n=1 Tax=Branchiostoma floridae TaxID=7739 RepID=C3Z9Y2_BRAFL|eukprot:XP_002594559.1 hypothetical protein BRAFLDRAFT_77527 [Branchiostoma floridae]
MTMMFARTPWQPHLTHPLGILRQAAMWARSPLWVHATSAWGPPPSFGGLGDPSALWGRNLMGPLNPTPGWEDHAQSATKLDPGLPTHHMVFIDMTDRASAQPTFVTR